MGRGGPRLSGLQRQVLSLYRSALRVSREKEQAGGESIAAYARQEIDRYRRVDRKDILRIEHLIRRGRRQLDLFQSSDVTGVRLQGGSSGGGSRSGSSSIPEAPAAGSVAGKAPG